MITSLVPYQRRHTKFTINFDILFEDTRQLLTI